MLRLISESQFIISDSGGIQEEATCFNKKILVMREKTERPETIDIGLGLLAGGKMQEYIGWCKTAPPRITKSPYGDGDAAKKIVQILRQQKQ